MSKKTLKVVKKGLKEAKDGKITSYTSVPQMLKALNSHKGWTYLDWLEHWWNIYFWNYVSMIPLNVKSFFQRGFRGYADSDTWDFDRYLTDVIEGGVKHLIKYNMRDDKKYIADLRIIVKTMKLSRKANDNPRAYASKEDWKKATKEFRQGMRVLAERWWQLWD